MDIFRGSMDMASDSQVPEQKPDSQPPEAQQVDTIRSNSKAGALDKHPKVARKKSTKPGRKHRETDQTSVHKPTPPAAEGKSIDAATQPADGTSAAGPQAEPAQSQPVDHGGLLHDQRSRFLLLAAVPSWLISMILHVVLLLMLAYITLPEARPNKQIVAVSTPATMEQLEDLDEPEIEPIPLTDLSSDAPVAIDSEQMPEDTLSVPAFTDKDAAPLHMELQKFGELTAPNTEMTSTIGNIGGTGLEGRGGEARKAMVRKYGGSKGSEAAVANALEWLAAHQMADGGWDFDHTRGPCKGRCSHPGIGPPARNAATAMALLPFLGAGQTHKEGEYKANVERGLAYLIKHMRVRSGMGDFVEPGGNMYSHGLAALTLTEAYAMTNDPGLLKPAQLALNYIVYAQDPVGGGWRYRPKQPGDTSVTGWQLMALKSGHLAYLKVPGATILGANKFLDFVQTDNGAKYGYTMPAARPSMTSVGLLCRMYLGWKRDESALKAGVEYLHALGPSPNIYYDYYATQVLLQYGGKMWDDWNAIMRDRMVKTQDIKGHAKGSWYFADAPHGSRGGRLYCTSMATMILEVYYRYMPLYGKEATEEDFPL